MSPRRSSRTRITQPTPTIVTQTNSSTSSISSGRAGRSTRSHQKPLSPRPSNPGSRSLDDPEEPAKPPPRRTRSSHDDLKKSTPPQADDDDEDDEEEEEEEEADEEEVTRCICGQAEYPGLPSTTSDALKRAAKESSSQSASDDIAPEELGGMFIQCDVCKVWQHGGCVGILDDASAPEEYFCEECRKDLHKLATTPSGQKYSRYLPLHDESSEPPSPEPTTRESRRGKDNKIRPSAEALAQKRRLTMNSRDEAEELRRAIEESKKDGSVTSVGEGPRRNKRSRSDSEDHKHLVKRQRTDSSSPSPEQAGRAVSSSDEALVTPVIQETPKKIRGAAARNHREKEQREQRERERQEAANRRKARSENRRRGDAADSDGEDRAPAIPPLPSTTASTPPASQEAHVASTSKSHTKKTGRPPVKRGRVGRNQYTRDRDLVPPTLHGSLDVDEDHPKGRGRSRSRSTMREGERHLNGAGALGVNGKDYGEVGRPSRVKHMNLNRTSLNEMKKRVAAILDFVNRAQDEGIGTPRSGSGSGSGSGNGSVKGGDGLAAAAAAALNGTTREDMKINSICGLDGTGDRPLVFKELSSADMVAALRGKLVSWEGAFGRWGEK